MLDTWLGLKKNPKAPSWVTERSRADKSLGGELEWAAVRSAASGWFQMENCPLSFCGRSQLHTPWNKNSQHLRGTIWRNSKDWTGRELTSSFMLPQKSLSWETRLAGAEACTDILTREGSSTRLLNHNLIINNSNKQIKNTNQIVMITTDRC